MESRKWMYNKNLPGGRGITSEFEIGVNEFVAWASRQHRFVEKEKIRCPCSKCKNCRFLPTDEVKVHLFRKGFMNYYFKWISHGEGFVASEQPCVAQKLSKSVDMVAQEVASGDKGAPVQDQAQDKGAVAPASPAPSTAAAKPSNVVVPSLPMFDVPSTSSTRGPRKAKLPGSPVSSSSSSSPTEMSASPVSPAAMLMESRKWMYNKNLPGRRGITPEFEIGVNEFVDWASRQHKFMDKEKIRCPCSKCKNRRFLPTDEVKVHLFRKGFRNFYFEWTSHGEGFVSSEQPSVAGKFPKSVELAAQRVASGDKGAPVRDQAQDHGAVASASLAPTSPAAQPLIVVVPSLPVPNAPSASATPKDTEPPISPVVHHHHHRPQWKHQHSRLLHQHHPKQKGQRANPFMSRPTCLGAWITYSSVPMEVRDTWFSSFKKFYSWDASCTTEMRKIFNNKASKWMTRTLYLARKKGKKLYWISDEHWGAMLVEWAGESFQVVSQKNKASSRSNMGTSTPVYRGGSVSMPQYKRKLEEELGRPPTCLELFERGWKKKR